MLTDSTLERLRILAESAKYDVSCSSSGTVRRGKQGMVGNTVGGLGICHSFADDGRCRILAAEPRAIALGEFFDAAENPSRVEGDAPDQLRLVQNGKTLVNGRLDKVGDQNAFLVESTSH